MADESMKVVIGAEVSQGVAGIQKFNKEVAKVKPGVQSATIALTNIGRVAQDLPFGFIGIANNLNPLLESFQRLKAETGSGKAALQALGSSLMGAGGLGIALSLVTAALSFVSVGFSAWTRGMGDSKKEAEENAKTVEVLVTNYEKFQKRLTEVIEAASKEAAEVSILFSALGDSNIKLEDRHKIIERLNKLSPAYLGNLDKEKSTYQEISTAVEDYLKNVATATQLKALLPEFEKIISKMVAAQVELNRIGRERKIAQGLGLFSAEDEKDFQDQSKRLQAIINGAVKEIQVAKKVMTDIAGSGVTLEEILFGKQQHDPPKEKDPVERIEKIRHAAVRSLEELQKLNEQMDIISGKAPPKKTAVTPTGAITPSINLKPAKVAMTQFQLDLQKMNDAIQKSMENVVLNVGVGVGEVIGDLLGGGFKSGIGAFLSLIGDALITIGKAAVQAGIEMLALKKALNVLFKTPQSAIIAGIAAIAIGTLIKSKIPKFAEGGIATKPTLGIFGEAGPEALIPLNKVNGLGNRFPEVIEFRQRGKDLVAVVAMGQRSQNRIT